MMQKGRHSPAVDTVSWITTAVLIALMMSAAITVQGTERTCKQFFNKDARLRLRDRHFNISMEDPPPGRWYTFNLTNGTLHTLAAKANPLICSGGGTNYYISAVGWHAEYRGTVTNMANVSNHFNVTVTLDQYTDPRNPVEVSISLGVNGNFDDAKVTHVTDFAINVNVTPPFTKLSVFPNKSDATEVQNKFESELWDQAKPDVKKVLQENYTESIRLR
ncbi:hypothetical protein MTO96_025654 [Rhipicephalus appendiculatus]